MVMQPKFVEFWRYSHNIVAISPILRNRIEQIDICILFMDQSRHYRRILIMLWKCFIIDSFLNIVVIAILDKILIENTETMEKVCNIHQITVYFLPTDTVCSLQHGFLGMRFNRFISFDPLSSKEGIHTLGQLNHLTNIVEDELVPIAWLEFFS